MSDPVEDYLDQLCGGLHTTAREARRIIAEAEDHLREATAAGVEAGLPEHEAQEAAIPSFGSVRAVVRAHARRLPPLAVFGELAMAAWKLASITPLAVAGSGLVAFAMNEVLGPAFVGGRMSGASGLPGAVCRRYLGLWPGVHYCVQAASLETRSDAVTLRLLALIPGLILLGGYLLARRYQRRRGWRANLLPDAFVATVAACLFGADCGPGPAGRRRPADGHRERRSRVLPVRRGRHPADRDRLRALAAPRPCSGTRTADRWPAPPDWRARLIPRPPARLYRVARRRKIPCWLAKVTRERDELARQLAAFRPPGPD